MSFRASYGEPRNYQEDGGEAGLDGKIGIGLLWGSAVSEPRNTNYLNVKRRCRELSAWDVQDSLVIAVLAAASIGLFPNL
jgi:hypothetical protein